VLYTGINMSPKLSLIKRTTLPKTTTIINDKKTL
jgi:hypothetical protein